MHWASLTTSCVFLFLCSCYSSSGSSFTGEDHEIQEEPRPDAVESIEVDGGGEDGRDMPDSQYDVDTVDDIPDSEEGLYACEGDYTWQGLNVLIANGTMEGAYCGWIYLGYVAEDMFHVLLCMMSHEIDGMGVYLYYYIVSFYDTEFNSVGPPMDLEEIGYDNVYNTFNEKYFYHDSSLAIILNKYTEPEAPLVRMLYVINLEGGGHRLVGQERIDGYFDWEVTDLGDSRGDVLCWTGSEYHIKYIERICETPDDCSFTRYLSRHRPDGSLIDIVPIEPPAFPGGRENGATYFDWLGDSYVRTDKFWEGEGVYSYYLSRWSPERGQETEPVRIDLGEWWLGIERFDVQAWTGSEYIVSIVRAVAYMDGGTDRVELLRLDEDFNNVEAPVVIRETEGTVWTGFVRDTDVNVTWNGEDLMAWVFAVWGWSSTYFFGDVRLYRLSASLQPLQDWILYDEEFRAEVWGYGVGVAKTVWLGDRYLASRRCPDVFERLNCLDYLVCNGE
jgi:hypothetical protein